MDRANLIPFLLTPAFKDYLWGGNKLKTVLHKQTPLQKVAESWELSCHRDGLSLIASGPHTGETLHDYLEQAGPAALGTNCGRFNGFPVLIKLLDAARPLSIQVHPDDAYALVHEHDNGKTEMWYIIDCDEGAQLYRGLRRPATKQELRERIADGTLCDILNAVPVKKGDAFMIPAGTLHGIGGGILVYEVQQSSNATYRVFDYNRLGPDGKPRALHIDKALDVATLGPAPAPVKLQAEQHDGYAFTTLASCDCFTAELYQITASAPIEADGSSFLSLTCTEGKGSLRFDGGKLPLAAGDTVFVPAGAGRCELAGHTTVLCVHC